MNCADARLARWSALAALALAVPGALAAQDATTRNHLYDKFQATADFTTVLNKSTARLDGSNGLGTTLDFTSLLGVSGTTIQPAIGLRWKPGRHTELDFGYQWINESGTRSFSDSIIIGDNTVFGQIDANTKIGSNNANFAFKYSIWAAEKHTIGLELGLGALFFDFQFDGTAEGCVGPDCAGGAVSVHESSTAGTAALGAFGQWRLGDHWYVGGDARGLGGSKDQYSVSIFQADAFAKYYFSNRWGAAAGWYYNDVTLNISGARPATSDLSGKITFNYTSLRLGAVYAF